MKIMETEFQTPVITINYEEVKNTLQEKLEDYKGLVVTEDTLKASKEAQKELANLRINIDDYRKKKKEELEQPIKGFEQQCKDLISLVQEAEIPLKKAIKVFDDQKRLEKKKIVEQLIEESMIKFGLYGKYAAELTVDDKYLNLSTSKKFVKEDLEQRAGILKQQQIMEEEKINTIQVIINAENEKIKNKMSINEFTYIINKGDMPEIVAEIKERGKKIYESENLATTEKTEEQVSEAKKKEQEKVVDSSQIEKIYQATYKVTGTYNELKSVSKFLKESEIAYQVTEQYEM